VRDQNEQLLHYGRQNCMIQGTISMIQGTIGMIQGTIGMIQEQLA
jgi:hypothetical protein